MRIKRKHIFIVPAIMVGVPALLALIVFILNPSKAEEKDFSLFLFLPVTFLIFAGVAAFLSLLVVAIVQKIHWETRIYFLGQLAVPVFVIGLMIYGYIDSLVYKQTKANVESNRNFLTRNADAGEDSVYLRALIQLENVVANDNDIDIYYSNIAHIDTSFNGRYESAAVILFGYTHKLYGRETLCSKHLVGQNVERILFYNEPLTPEIEAGIRDLHKNVNETFQKLIDLHKELKKEGKQEDVKKLEEVLEEFKDLPVDSLQPEQ